MDFKHFNDLNEKHRLYLVLLYNKNERFYKIGITGKSINERMSWIKDYKYEIIYDIEMDGVTCRAYESILKEKVLDYKMHYKPKCDLCGWTECYKENYKDELINAFNYIQSLLLEPKIKETETIIYHPNQLIDIDYLLKLVDITGNEKKYIINHFKEKCISVFELVQFIKKSLIEMRYKDYDGILITDYMLSKIRELVNAILKGKITTTMN